MLCADSLSFFLFLPLEGSWQGQGQAMNATAWYYCCMGSFTLLSVACLVLRNIGVGGFGEGRRAERERAGRAREKSGGVYFLVGR